MALVGGWRPGSFSTWRWSGRVCWAAGSRPAPPSEQAGTRRPDQAIMRGQFSSFRRARPGVTGREIMQDVVIVAATRTAVGAFQGSLANLPATALGEAVVRKLLADTGVAADQISEVILGQVLTA